MLRDEASAVLSAGGPIEAGDMVLRMLRVALPSAGVGGDDRRRARGAGVAPLAPAAAQAVALLQAAVGVKASPRGVPAPAQAAPVARFLLFERNYPDSVAAAV